jgi:hypothetical protein
MAVPTTSLPPLSEESLKQYAGQWVAIRGNRVVAAAATFEELKRDPRVTQEDAIYHVPPAASVYY